MHVRRLARLQTISDGRRVRARPLGIIHSAHNVPL